MKEKVFYFLSGLAAPFFFTAISLAGVIGFNKMIDFNDYIIGWAYTIGCYPEAWMVVGHFIFSFFYSNVLWIVLCIYFNRKFVKDQLLSYAILGFLTFCHLANMILGVIINSLRSSPFWFYEMKDKYRAKPMPLVGNLFNLKSLQLYVQPVFLVVVVALITWLFSRVWNKKLMLNYFIFVIVGWLIGTWGLNLTTRIFSELP